MKLCAWMRAKSLYGRRFATEEELAAALLNSGAQFSCLRTCQPWGPDGQLCAPETCGDGRSCFELSPKSPRRRTVV